MTLTEKDKKRFWAKVDIQGEDECWEWLAYCDYWGYGNFSLNSKPHKAHRASWAIAFGEPGKLLVCHHCDNKKCVNPKHLFLGTHADNARDMMNKGRGKMGKGELHPNSKLTTKEVLEIRDLTSAGLSQTHVAKIYGVDCCTINHIVHKRRWKHI